MQWPKSKWQLGMPILDDNSLIRAVTRTGEIKPGSLWEHLDCCARYLTLVGAKDAAVSVWSLAYDGRIMVPENGDDCAVTALCKSRNIQDLSKGRPRARFLTGMEDMSSRLDRYDFNCRSDLARDRWLPTVDKGDIRKGLDLARPHEGQLHAHTELEALLYFDAFLQSGRGEGPSTVLDVMLLCSDIAFRHHQAERAQRYLESWADLIANPYTGLQFCFRLKSTAEQILRGTLSYKSSLSADEISALVNTLQETLADILRSPPQIGAKTIQDWQSFLAEFSIRFLEAHDDEIEAEKLAFPGFLGEKGATDQQISDAELRLKAYLPLSYRSFLSASNGWAAMGDAQPGRLLSVAEITPYHSMPSEDILGLDAEFLQYGIEEYNRSCGRKPRSHDYVGLLNSSIIISEWGDASILMLLPDYQTPSGEWLCVNFASWNPGFVAYDNFSAWFRKTYERI